MPEHVQEYRKWTAIAEAETATARFLFSQFPWEWEWEELDWGDGDEIDETTPDGDDIDEHRGVAVTESCPEGLRHHTQR